jgi:beta-glucosidase
VKTENFASFAVALFVMAAALPAASVPLASGESRPPYLDPAAPLETRVEDLLGRLTLEEKISLVHGDSKFTTAAIPRLGLPRRWFSDGPHGVREEVLPDSFRSAGHTDDFATCLPVLLALAATWNPDAARAYGDVIGEEARQRGKDIMLGPGVNIARTPLNGRTSEYLGEDPYLAARLAVSYIRAVQSHDVASCVKHFAVNNQETQRTSVNVEMDERTLQEIYLPAFRAAVQEGGAWAVMGAYNKFRGQFCCHNDYLLNRVLKGEWGFRGIVISDWNGTHDTREAARNGLDVEMGTLQPYDDYYLARPFREGLRQGEFAPAVLDDKVRRSLRVMLATHVLDEGRAAGSINTPAHQAAARRIAEEAIVLLKNEGAALPLDPAKLASIAVIGENATRLHAYGGDSAKIKALYEVSPLDGILRRVGDHVTVTYSPGYRSRDADPELVERAVAAARAADVAIVIGGLIHQKPFDCEGADRSDLKLPFGQDELIRRVVAANPRTIVVLVSGSPVEMDAAWLAPVPAVVEAWYGGSEAGNALARVLFGDVNPSGKLPCTFPQKLADSPAHALGAYPGRDGVVRYEEGLLVGYRWFDTKQIEPLFPFGHGLSYTRFAYSALKIVPGTGGEGSVATVEFEIANTGAREGAEVAQVYVHDVAASVPRPVQELKAFRKVSLQPGEKQTVSIPLGREAFAFYDAARRGWVAEAGEFTIHVGSSSRDVRLTGGFRLATTSFAK